MDDKLEDLKAEGAELKKHLETGDTPSPHELI